MKQIKVFIASSSEGLKITNVIKELLQTEFNYIKDLEVIEYVSVENIPDQRQSRLFNIILG